MKLFNKSTRSKEGIKMNLFDKVRKNPQSFLKILSTSFLVILPFCICALLAFYFTLYFIRNDAYKYNADTYKEIEDVLCGVEVTLSDGNVQIQNPKITLSDGTVEEIMPCIVKGEGIDDSVLRQYLDNYGGTYNINYDNGQTVLTCSITDGYFTAEVTTQLSNNYEITNMSRNYNSLGEYMDHLIRIVGLVVFGIALIAFFGIEALIFGIPAIYGYVAKKQDERKKKKEERVSSDTALAPEASV